MTNTKTPARFIAYPRHADFVIYDNVRDDFHRDGKYVLSYPSRETAQEAADQMFTTLTEVAETS